MSTTKIIIQCAGKKAEGARKLVVRENSEIQFIADNDGADLSNPGYFPAKPDDLCATGATYRAVLSDYNTKFAETGFNPNDLSPAYRLYKHPAYRFLVNRFGHENVYIFSAGWGLVRSGFLLPDYNITFSDKADQRNTRNISSPGWDDYNQLIESDAAEKIHVLITPSYFDLFYRITHLWSRKESFIIHHKVAKIDRKLGYNYQAFLGRASTNWYYSAAKELSP